MNYPYKIKITEHKFKQDYAIQRKTYYKINHKPHPNGGHAVPDTPVFSGYLEFHRAAKH